jgi:hypothetical protein
LTRFLRRRPLLIVTSRRTCVSPATEIASATEAVDLRTLWRGAQLNLPTDGRCSLAKLQSREVFDVVCAADDQPSRRTELVVLSRLHDLALERRIAHFAQFTTRLEAPQMQRTDDVTP